MERPKYPQGYDVFVTKADIIALDAMQGFA
jgi:hypothetical protein